MAFIKASVGRDGVNNKADLDIIVELILRAQANFLFLLQPTVNNLEQSENLFSIGVNQAIEEFVKYAARFYSTLKIPDSQRQILNRAVIFPDDSNYQILLACAVCGNRPPTLSDFDQNPLLKRAINNAVSYSEFKQAIASGSSCNDAVNAQSTAEKLDEATVNLLRKNPEKLYANQTFKTFIEAVIGSLPTTFVFDDLRAEKYGGTILENFDRVRNAKGYWIDFLSGSQAKFHRGKITFNRKDFKPSSTLPIIFIYDRKEGTPSTSSVASQTVNSQATEALATTFILAHELIHAYWSPIDIPTNMDHAMMDRATKSAVEKLNLKSDIPFETFFKHGSANYFTVVLGAICGNIKL